MIRRAFVRRSALGAVVAATLLAGAPARPCECAADPGQRRPVQQRTSQHATEVEPDTFAFGSTVVAAYQVGRFFDGGASDIGFARSSDGGATWGVSSFLPGLTFSAGGSPTGSPFERVSDASVAYDAKHATWMISSIPITPAGDVPTIFVSLSTNGGASFSARCRSRRRPRKVNLDKNWTVCDNHPASPFYGHCYTEFDNFGEGDLEYMSTSSDGGYTWSAPVSPRERPRASAVSRSCNPTAPSWCPSKACAARSPRSDPATAARPGPSGDGLGVSFHPVAGDLRTSPLPSAEIDGAGTVYVAWEDCRFEPKCTANDIVLSRSADGVNWSAVTRIPLDAVERRRPLHPRAGGRSGHVGAGAHLALTYYFYPSAACTTATCQLDAGYFSSPDGGANWSPAPSSPGPCH